MKHWHGAAADSWMSHVAFEAPGIGCENEWLEPVTDEQYDEEMLLRQKRRNYEMELRERAVKAYRDMKDGKAFSLEEVESELGLA